jgi:pyridinium-3,5-bisthiocarboxylic acid mononucleotide nickel chelatase
VDAEPRIKTDARGMLDILVAAEGKVHGVPREQVHFHELSHIDTLIDILSVAKGMHHFGIEKVYCGPVPMGSGTIKISHGIVPNPPPATVEILRDYNLLFLNEAVELTTPTGATVIRYYVKDRTPAPAFAIEKIGYGMGSYESEKPDAVRIFMGTSDDPSHDEEVWLIEVDLDDMEMEYIGAVADRIRETGALDVVYFPVHMKKGRIGVRLSITAPLSAVQRLIDTVLAETTTFGLRLRREQRRVLRREEKVVETSCGPVRVKKGYNREGNLVKTHIEFDDVKRIADETKVPYRKILDAIKSELSFDRKVI